MDIKYISHNLILILYGILGTIIYIIIGIIITQFNCELNDCNVYNYICNVNYNNKYYIDSFYNYFSKYKNGVNEIIREIIVIISGNLIFSEENYYGFLAINNKSLMAKFFLDVSGDIFSLIGFLIYLEIIKLKCGGLHYNLRANIIERGAIELMVVRDNSFSSSFSSDIEKSLPEKGSALFRDSTIMENNELPPEKNE